MAELLFHAVKAASRLPCESAAVACLLVYATAGCGDSTNVALADVVDSSQVKDAESDDTVDLEEDYADEETADDTDEGTAGDDATSDLPTDSAGSCSEPCAPNMVCPSSGTCECDALHADCDGESANGCEIMTAADAANCGACGVACAGGESCGAGTCFVPTASSHVVAAGANHTCAIAGPDRAVYCWGSNQRGQLGDGNVGSASSSASSPSPVQAVGLTGVTQVTAGVTFTCAVNDQTWCWGGNFDGQLGNNDSGNGADSPVPVPVYDSLPAVPKQISAGGNHVCALVDTGQLYCWGAGIPSTKPHYPRPLLMPALFFEQPVEQVSVGSGYACVVQEDRTAMCWGDNAQGQLGEGTRTDQIYPVNPVVGLGDVALIVAGEGSHTCAVLLDGQVYCWGSNEYGQLGLPLSQPFSATPVPIEGIRPALGVSVGSEHTCALEAIGTAVCWGADENGTLGDGAATQGRGSPDPRPVVDAGDLVFLTSGRYHTCAVHALSNEVSCWGWGGLGQLGVGDTENRASPTPVMGLP